MRPPLTDGLYRAIRSPTSVGWMRFYATGEMLLAGTPPAPAARIACWLRAGAAEYIAQGRWTLDGDTVRGELTVRYQNPGQLVTTVSTHEIAFDDEGRALTDRWVTTSNDRRVGRIEGASSYVFVPVPPRFLEGDVAPRDVRVASSLAGLVKEGFDPAQVARAKACRKVPLAKLNSLEADELVAAGLEADFVAAFIRWRLGEATGG
ncbi:MAG: hypothetical protein R3A48_11645 [Polyangiales bacterium]